jgi:lysophospholipase L1-like esterase
MSLSAQLRLVQRLTASLRRSGRMSQVGIAAAASLVLSTAAAIRVFFGRVQPVTVSLALVASAYARIAIRLRGDPAALTLTTSAAIHRIVAEPVFFDPMTFEPDQLLDAGDDATITITGSGVSQWADKSGRPETIGSGRNATMAQTDDALRPVVVTDAFGKKSVWLEPGKEMSSLWSIIDFSIGGDYTGPGMFAAAATIGGLGTLESTAILGDFGFISDDNGKFNVRAGCPGVPASVVYVMGQSSFFRDVPWLDVGADAEVVLFSNKHADGTGTRGIALFSQKANKKSFFYFREFEDASTEWFPLWSITKIGETNAGGVGIREVCYALGAKSDTDCHLYFRSLYSKWLASRIKNHIFFLGDSITFGYELDEEESFPYLVMNTVNGGIDADYINAGISGRKVSEIVGDVAAYTPLYRPFQQNVAVLLEGINDLMDMDTVGGHIPVLNALWTCCDTLRNQGYRVLVLTVIPAPAENPGEGNIWMPVNNAEIQAYNAAIVAGWAAHADAMIDLTQIPEFSVWGTETADENASYANTDIYQDRIHPTAAGAALIANAIASTVAALLVP